MFVQSTLSELEKENFNNINNCLNNVLRIAQSRLDIKVVLFCKLLKITTTEEGNKAVFEDVKKLAVKKGISSQQYIDLFKEIYIELVKVRSCDWYDADTEKTLKNKVFSLSVSEIILHLKQHQDLLEENVVQEGLAPLDTYYATISKKKMDNILHNHIMNYKLVLNKVKDFLADYLVHVECELLTNKEREELDAKKELEVLIAEGYEVKTKCFVKDTEHYGIYDHIKGQIM
jgi:hypothetical protein